MFEEWVGEASVLDFGILLRPSEGLSWREHCTLTGMGVRYRSAGKSKWKFPLERKTKSEEHL